MIVKTFKVFSYCDDFDHSESMQDTLADYGGNDVYVSYTAYSKENLEAGGYSFR